MLTAVVKNVQNMGTLAKLVRSQQQRIVAGLSVPTMHQHQAMRCISKSPENEANVDYLTFREQVSPLMKNKKYNMKRAYR